MRTDIRFLVFFEDIFQTKIEWNERSAKMRLFRIITRLLCEKNRARASTGEKVFFWVCAPPIHPPAGLATVYVRFNEVSLYV